MLGPRRLVQPRRVLVIEDNQDAALSLADALELDGHEVAVAFDGAQGVAMARALRPEVVLCDIGLPGGMDGYDVAREICADPSLAGAFLVAVTGYVLAEDLQRAREAGFQGHLAKPLSFDQLDEMLAAAGPVVSESRFQSAGTAAGGDGA